MRNIIVVSVVFMIGMIIGGCTKTVTNTVVGNNGDSASGAMTWTIRTAGVPAGGSFWSGSPCIVWGNNEFVAVGYDTTLTSVDGKTWIVHASHFPYYFGKVVWGANMFVAISEDSIFTSPDGITWTKQFSAAPSRLSAITWGDSQFVAVGLQTTVSGQTGFDTAYAFISKDGINWTENKIGPGFTASIVWGNDRYVAIGNSTFTSTDGILWSQDSVTIGVNNSSGIAYGDGMFAAIGVIDLYTSPDGINWKTSLLEFVQTPVILWNGNRFIVASNEVLTSTDGINWSAQPTLPTSIDISTMAVGNNIIVGLSAGAGGLEDIVTSP